MYVNITVTKWADVLRVPTCLLSSTDSNGYFDLFLEMKLCFVTSSVATD